jgi:membrane associated rhomboid family serine protease
MFIPIGDDVRKQNLPFVGIILIALNVVVFFYSNRLLMESLPKDLDDFEAFASFDVNKTPYGKFMQAWGLVPAKLPKGDVIGIGSHMFLHADLMHLVGNMVVLWAFVGSLENALGMVNFLCFYLLWGLAAGLAHAGLNWGDKLPMIGASGAVAGMMGAYFVLFGALAKIRTWTWLGRSIKISVPAGLYAFLWVMLQIAGIDQETRTGKAHIAYYAHVGGFAVGAVSMLFLREQIHRRLAINSAGQLEIKDEPPADKTARAPVASYAPAAPVASKVPVACPHCWTPLAEEHKLADNMFRCPGEGCKRLILMQ